MRSSNLFFRVFLSVAAALIVGEASDLQAQVNTEFQISKIECLMPSTPNINSDAVPKPTGAAKKWVEVDVSFFWKPRLATDKFSDDLVFNYYVLLANHSTLNPQGTLLSGQVTHTAVAANKPDLRSVLYITPSALERFFDGRVPASTLAAIVDIGVTISRQGQIVAMKSFKGSGAWWTQFQQTSGFLLNKSETPFAPLYWDYFEPAKKL